MPPGREFDSAQGQRVANVIAPPPFIFLGALTSGVLLQAVRPALLFVNALAAQISGAILIAGGLALSAAVVHAFRRAGTSVSPRRASQRLVVSGPYGFSRNPDYLGQAIAYCGLSLVLNALWVLIAIVPALLFVQYGVIGREERYLEDHFGEEYRVYRRRVRRWL